MATETEFGDRLRDLRVERGWSQEMLAHKIGRTSGYVNRLERGATDPMRTTVGSLLQLAEALGVSMYELLGMEPPEPLARF